MIEISLAIAALVLAVSMAAVVSDAYTRMLPAWRTFWEVALCSSLVITTLCASIHVVRIFL